MKKLLSVLTLLCIVISSFAFASCGGGTTKVDDGLQKAYDYIFQNYKDAAEVTPSDYEMMSSVKIGDEKFTVTWSVDVAEGITITDDGKVSTIDVNEKTPTEIAYVLKGEIKNEKGETKTISFNRKVPAFKVLSYAEYVALEDKQPLVVEGVVTGIMAKSKGNSYNCLYLQTADGGFYAYSLALDPVASSGIEVGMTVQVTGTRDTYSGTYEIASPVAEIIKAEKTDVTPVDYTELYTAAADLKAADLNAKQAFLVTIKGVEVTGEDTSSGYYKFKIGDKESYVRISSSVCPIDKTAQESFKKGHAEHLGWTADVTGITCVYDGAFYLTPVSADAFTYISLPKKSDAEMIDFELANLKLTEKVTEDTAITLAANGQGYTDVKYEWASDNACAVVKDGKLTVTLPEADTEVKVTVTAKAGAETKTKEFKILVEAAQSKVYENTIVTAPVKDTAYKFGTEQVQTGKWIYFTGEMDGNYFATTTNPEKAADVFIEEVEGGYRAYFKSGDKKTYIDIYEYQTGKAGVRLTDAPSAVYTWLEAANTAKASVAGGEFYIGTYNTNVRLSASATSYITGDNAAKIGVSQFPAHFITLKELVPTVEKAAELKADQAYKIYVDQKQVEKVLYFAGAMDGNYFATTDKADKATDVFVETVEGGYRVFFKQEDKKMYLDVYEYQTGKAGVRITDAPSAVYTVDAATGTFVTKFSFGDFYVGTYNTNVRLSASNISYISGENAAKIGVSQFPASLGTVSYK